MTTNDLAIDKLSDQIQIYSQRQFSGRLDVQGATTWSLYFCLGRLVWATGGTHPHRRWYRYLSQYFPQIASNSIRLRETDITRYWEYQILTVLVKRQKIAGEQAVAAIKSTVAEVLFDILQHQEKQQLTYTCTQEEVLDASLTLISPAQALQESQQAWETWRSAGLANLSPNLAPVLKQAEELQKLASPRVYQTLVKVIDGKRSLRDLALLVKQDLLTLVRSLTPYIRKKIIGLVEIADLPKPGTTATTPPPQTAQSRGETEIPPTEPLQQIPIAKPLPSPPPPPPPPTVSIPSRPLVAYVEDSTLDCQIMEDILLKASYKFLSIKDSMQALPLLLQHKPDVIFLDLVMPVANGYEICAQIRRISSFKNTPVIILTGNDGIVDRVRAKMVGATDFLSKPVVANKVLAALRKHLNSSPVSDSEPQLLRYQTS
ncbi:response regulator [Planktothrix sp. FACHB-1355]|uniref:Protein PatA n=1 Tax=Aerosakkonema funiforme FACHB-1375 TaxID=2949571 RepID=A0A926ZH56_9CYAN|nr:MULTISPECIES: response regulator [Oscillatoriales]MBD2182675.1 response regulator [Aerosakkonema funiforme FACHB-1375]MBD3559768.1 response regulator [Planktothrix sp. FACHB-1355]